MRPEKEEEFRTGITVEDDKVNYEEDCGILRADMQLVKIKLNGTKSKKGACFVM